MHVNAEQVRVCWLTVVMVAEGWHAYPTVLYTIANVTAFLPLIDEGTVWSAVPFFFFFPPKGHLLCGVKLAVPYWLQPGAHKL